MRQARPSGSVAATPEVRRNAPFCSGCLRSSVQHHAPPPHLPRASCSGLACCTCCHAAPCCTLKMQVASWERTTVRPYSSNKRQKKLNLSARGQERPAVTALPIADGSRACRQACWVRMICLRVFMSALLANVMFQWGSMV